jgi:hypothetical protein
MHARRLSIILLLGALCIGALGIAPAVRAEDSAAPTTVARQNYSYDPRANTVMLDLKTVYSGHDAQSFRGFYAKAGADGYAKAKLDYYRTMYDVVAEAAPPTVKDDTDRNVIETTERYRISLAGREDDEPLHRFAIYPDLMRGFFSRLPPLVHHPYPLDAASDRRDIVTVDAPTLGLYAIPGGAVSSAYFTFTRNARAMPGHIEMDYRLRFLTDSVPVAEFERYRADIERMDHNIYAWIDLDRDFYHRYYRDMPAILRGATAAILAVALGGAWWFLCRRGT